MPAMTPEPKDSPLMKAWEAYKQTPEYANTKQWASKEEHTEGSLWAAFSAGFGKTEKLIAERSFLFKLVVGHPEHHHTQSCGDCDKLRSILEQKIEQPTN